MWRDELNEGKVLLRDIIDLEAMYGAGPDGAARQCRRTPVGPDGQPLNNGMGNNGMGNPQPMVAPRRRSPEFKKPEPPKPPPAAKPAACAESRKAKKALPKVKVVKAPPNRR